MNDIVYEINNQIYVTMTLVQGFFKNVNLLASLLGAGLFYVIFLRKWALKKLGSFLLLIFLLFILMLRLEDFLNMTLSREGFDIAIGITRTTCFIIMTSVFIYHAAIKE